MASHGRDIAYSAGEITGQAQMEKDDFLNQMASDGPQASVNKASDNFQSAQFQNPTITSQATNFLQQTGEQVKNMAQGAAEAVKSTLGMNAENNPNNPNSPYSTNYDTSSLNSTNYDTNYDTSRLNSTNYDTSSLNSTNYDTSSPNTTNYNPNRPNTTNYNPNSPNTTNYNTSSTNYPSNPSNRRI